MSETTNNPENVPSADSFYSAKLVQNDFNIDMAQIMIEFAQMHVTAALKKASEEAGVIYHDGHFKENTQHAKITVGSNHIKPDKVKILNAYPPENIK